MVRPIPVPSYSLLPLSRWNILNILSENGTYSIVNADLQIETPDTISIGSNITLQMYPVRFKFSQSSAGKILEVKYTK